MTGAILSSRPIFRPIRLRQQRDRLCDGLPGGTEAVGELEMASRIAGGDDGDVSGLHAGDFAVEKLQALLGLGDVVDAGAAAAPIRVRQFLQNESGDALEDLAGL